jgi:hypothetical protein
MKISSVRGDQVSFESPPSMPVAQSVGSQSPTESPFSRALRGLGREIDVGERQVAGASQLRSYDTGTLIALQVGIYRYTEAVDLASKIVDRATNAVHTVLSGGGH